MRKSVSLAINERGLQAPFVCPARATGAWWRRNIRFLHLGFRGLERLLAQLLLRVSPEEDIGERVPPWTALFRTGPCLAWCLLVWNDHYGKGSTWLPPFVAGKLSDFAGLAFFPLLLVALGNSMMCVLGRVSPRLAPLGALHLWQLQLSCLMTGVVFSAIQLFPPVAELYRQICIVAVPWDDGRLVRVVSDPSDLLALCAVALAYRWGQGAIAQIPPGRLHYAQCTAQKYDSALKRALAMEKALFDVQCSQPANLRGQMRGFIWACAVRAPASELRCRLHQVRKHL